MRVVCPVWYRKTPNNTPKPSSFYKRYWRQRERAVEKRRVAECKDYDALCLPPPHRVSSIYDWY